MACIWPQCSAGMASGQCVTVLCGFGLKCNYQLFRRCHCIVANYHQMVLRLVGTGAFGAIFIWTPWPMQFRRLVLVHKPLFYIQILPVQDKKHFYYGKSVKGVVDKKNW